MSGVDYDNTRIGYTLASRGQTALAGINGGKAESLIEECGIKPGAEDIQAAVVETLKRIRDATEITEFIDKVAGILSLSVLSKPQFLSEIKRDVLRIKGCELQVYETAYASALERQFASGCNYDLNITPGYSVSQLFKWCLGDDGVGILSESWGRIIGDNVDLTQVNEDVGKRRGVLLSGSNLGGPGAKQEFYRKRGLQIISDEDASIILASLCKFAKDAGIDLARPIDAGAEDLIGSHAVSLLGGLQTGCIRSKGVSFSIDQTNNPGHLIVCSATYYEDSTLGLVFGCEPS